MQEYPLSKIGCRRNPAMMRRRSDASRSRNESWCAAAVERVLWHGDMGRQCPRARRSRSRSSPVRRITSRSRRGAGRWVIRWAKPGRIGPYQAHPRTLLTSRVWYDLQVFPCLKARRTPCFTRERSQVRNPPRTCPKSPAGTRFAELWSRVAASAGMPWDQSCDRTWRGNALSG
jgi:hypothetical protein